MKEQQSISLDNPRKEFMELVSHLDEVEAHAILIWLRNRTNGESKDYAWKEAIKYLSEQPGYEETARRWMQSRR